MSTKIQKEQIETFYKAFLQAFNIVASKVVECFDENAVI